MNGFWGVDESKLSDALANSLAFKLAFNQFGDLKLEDDYPAGFDFARNKTAATNKIGKLDMFEEQYTTKNWLLRVYKVLPHKNRAPRFANAPKRSSFVTPYPEE